jgi:hypothetical protein
LSQNFFSLAIPAQEGIQRNNTPQSGQASILSCSAGSINQLDSRFRGNDAIFSQMDIPV